MLARLDCLVIELLLCLAAWDEAVLRDVVAEAVGCLAILPSAFEVGISDTITELLEVGVGARLEMLVQFRLVVAVFDAQVDNLAGGLCVGKIECRGAVELDILGRNSDTAREKVALDVEDLHGETSRLRDAVVEARVAGLGAVAADDRVFGAMVEHALFEVFGEVVVDDQLAFDDALSPSVGSFRCP